MLILLRGAGDIATGIALRLHRAGFAVVMTDLAKPTAIRRTVCFSEAIRQGSTEVEGVRARCVQSTAQAAALAATGTVAVLADPAGACIPALQPNAVVDAILAKRNLGTKITDAPIVIGVGPGFTAGVDCHAAVETMRGHYLGRVLYTGSPLPNTGVPGSIGGYTTERVLRAPADGVFKPHMEIGRQVHAGETAADVAGVPMLCTIDGVLRGILPAGTVVQKGMKSGDIDPRCAPEHCLCASDKALAVGGGVLEAILHFSQGWEVRHGTNTESDASRAADR
jgi:xanthine dehydrogenase accessory factor